MTWVNGCVSLLHSCWDISASGASAAWPGTPRHSTGSTSRVQRNSLCSNKFSWGIQSHHDSDLNLKHALLVKRGSSGRRNWVWSSCFCTAVAARVLDFPSVRFFGVLPSTLQLRQICKATASRERANIYCWCLHYDRFKVSALKILSQVKILEYLVKTFSLC